MWNYRIDQRRNMHLDMDHSKRNTWNSQNSHSWVRIGRFLQSLTGFLLFSRQTTNRKAGLVDRKIVAHVHSMSEGVGWLASQVELFGCWTVFWSKLLNLSQSIGFICRLYQSYSLASTFPLFIPVNVVFWGQLWWKTSIIHELFITGFPSAEDTTGSFIECA